jgi:hypothetical protein
MLGEMQQDLGHVKGTNEAIFTQTKATNGRVTKIEDVTLPEIDRRIRSLELAQSEKTGAAKVKNSLKDRAWDVTKPTVIGIIGGIAGYGVGCAEKLLAKIFNWG